MSIVAYVSVLCIKWTLDGKIWTTDQLVKPSTYYSMYKARQLAITLLKDSDSLAIVTMQ